MKSQTRAWACVVVILLVASTSQGFGGSTVPCGAVTGVIISTGGTGYAAGDVGRPVTFTGGGGSGATGIIGAVSGGAVTVVSIITFGAAYTSAPAVTISAPLGGGTTATGTATVSPPCPCGTLAAVFITTGGSGYTGADINKPVTITGGGGSGATAIISGVSGGGAVTNVLITNPGSGYTSAPAATFSPPGGGGTTATGTTAVGPCGVPTVPSSYFWLSLIALFATGALVLSQGRVALAAVRRTRRE